MPHPVCVRCTRPVSRRTHYCAHCGAPTGTHTEYLPFQGIPFEVDALSRLWRGGSAGPGHRWMRWVILLLMAPGLLLLGTCVGVAFGVRRLLGRA